MVINSFNELFEATTKLSSLSLPAYKENGYIISFNGFPGDKVEKLEKVLPLPFASSEVFEADISSWRRLTAQHDDCKAVYEITFNVQDSNFTFKAGDTIGVLPKNSEEEVNQIIEHLSLPSDVPYSLVVQSGPKAVQIPAHIPAVSTLRHVLTNCVDLRSVVKKLFLLALSRHTKDENERKVLEYLCSKEGSLSYTSHVLNKTLSIIDILTIFPSCKPPIEVLLANLPRLLPRPYSIVNSGLVNKNEIKICFSVINIDSRRKGVTTGWLEQIILNKESSSIENTMQRLSINKENTDQDIRMKIPIYLRKNFNTFSLPEDLKTPLILIGSGTGVAPFIGFLEEREHLKTDVQELGEVWLFFGCRNPKLDYIYKEEIVFFLKNGTINKLITAFSRIKNEGKVYVQDCITQQGKEIVDLIQNGAMVFVCGDHKIMATQVKVNLEKCLVEYGDMSENEAQLYITNMEKQKRYIVDVWS